MLTNQQHPSRLLSDYVLQLLPPGQEQKVERHLASCEQCRAMVQHERALARDVRRAILHATEPSPARLRQLRPEPPPARRFRTTSALRPVAALAVLLLLFLGALQINGPGGDNAFVYPSQTSLAATATQTPTATQPAEGDHPDEAGADLETAVRRPLPLPASTPLAAVTLVGTGS